MKQVNVRKIVRTGDPWTSYAAAMSLGSLKPSEQAVLYLFAEYGDMTQEAMTDIAEAQAIRFSPQRLRSACAALCESGQMVDTGKKAVLKSGNRGRVMGLALVFGWRQ